MMTREYNGTDYLIIGDKVGDIIAFDLPNLSKKNFWITTFLLRFGMKERRTENGLLHR